MPNPSHHSWSHHSDGITRVKIVNMEPGQTAQTEIYFIDDALISFRSWKVWLLGWNAAWSCTDQRTLRLNVEPPSSWSKGQAKDEQMAGKTYPTTRRHSSMASVLQSLLWEHQIPQFLITATGLYYTEHVFHNGSNTGDECSSPPSDMDMYRRADNSRPVSTVSAWEWVYATSLCRLQRETRERETSKRLVGEAHSVLVTAILLPQHVSCYWGKIVSLRMLADLVWSLRNREPTARICSPTYMSFFCVTVTCK
jgi:hypothetical protein